MRVLIIGATSDIGHAIAAALAADGATTLDLTGRDAARLERVAADLRTRHAVTVHTHVLDVRDRVRVTALWRDLAARPDGVVYAPGVMPEQADLQADPDAVAALMETNFLGAVCVGELAAAEFEQRGAGFIVGVSSVAGERGRASNYLYGASKAALTTWLSGLRNRLQGTGVKVITVLPGFVATRMTAHLDLKGPLVAQPEEVGRAVVRALRGRGGVVHVRRVWWPIMAVIKMLPEWLFVRTRL